MTPERAEELADGYVHLSSGIRESFARTILAACAEERHAALTEIEALRAALQLAKAALEDIGDADREPGDDVAWCERRAAQPLPIVRTALAAKYTRKDGA